MSATKAAAGAAAGAAAPPVVVADAPPPVDGCDTCPARSTSEDSSYGYCEGCSGRERLCPSCERFQPQRGWGYGFSGLTWKRVNWVCDGCRFRPDAQRGPDRFVVPLGVEGQARTMIAYELTRAAQRNQAHPVAEVLALAATSVEATGDIDIDVGPFDQEGRRALLMVTRELSAATPPHLYQVAHQVHRAWVELVDAGEPPPPQAPPQPTVAERVAHIERPVPAP